jgi:hypothetical protein
MVNIREQVDCGFAVSFFTNPARTHFGIAMKEVVRATALVVRVSFLVAAPP